ncbi:hypothetical protein GM921_08305 [Pedobacter sp. LMG 31464]|uniref:Outer membrane protein beta-barrel domain-containing protein n=1 Tax=Pedobacter planticolens TaxID=2679964 RepID=A0A923DYN1_9SPHI|nr:hypothetical protein [Pedobacter planticolens]MBB2145481.1 hypothetical protein [Pedobacter planticolens]
MDEELVLQIKSVFEDVDDGGSDNGWLALREKYPEENKKLPIWWLTGIAASIVVAFGLFLVVNKSPKEIEQTTQTAKTKTDVKPKPSSAQGEQPTSVKQDEVVASTIKKEKQPIVLMQENASAKTVERKSIEEKVKTNPAENVIAVNAMQAGVANKVDTVKEKIQQNAVIANNVVVTPTETKNTKKTTEEFLQEQTKLLAKNPTKVEDKSKSIKNSIDVFTGTFLNYYADNAVKLNAGFGVNANVKVTKGVFVSFGAGVSQNKIDYKNSVPVAAVASSDALNSYAGKGSITTSSISDVKVNASLLNLDLPVTLKFYPTKKQNFYVAAGVNSNSYLTQKYTYGYNVNTVSSLGYTSEPKEETEKTKLKGFDFANSAIFAIGINQNIGKNNSLIFEPYFKPAIGSMGDKNLRINTVGLNLKFSFTPSQKK